MVTNEFTHVVKISEIGNHSHNIKLSADASARSGLMARFDLAALDSLDAEVAPQCLVVVCGIDASGRCDDLEPVGQCCSYTGGLCSELGCDKL